MNAAESGVCDPTLGESLQWSAGVASNRTLVGTWRSLNSAHCRIEYGLTEAVREVGISLVEFSVLDILEEQNTGHLRMQDVSLVAALSTGATTRLVSRLEERGLLRRVLCETDRRGIYTELTEEGIDLLKRARVLHDAALAERFEDVANIKAVSAAALSMTAS